MSPGMSRRRRDAGLSVVEIAVASTIFAVVLGIVGAGIVRAHGAWRGTSARRDAERRAATSLERIVARLTDCGGATITATLAPPSGGSAITYRERKGWASNAPVYGELITIAWETDPGDAQNGADDDRDGIVDEGQVAITIGTGSATKKAVLVQNVANRLENEVGGNSADDNGNGLVDERGFSIDRVGPRLTIRLTVERMGPDKVRVLETAQTTIRLDG